jgi:hypothetical protein
MNSAHARIPRLAAALLVALSATALFALRPALAINGTNEPIGATLSIPIPGLSLGQITKTTQIVNGVEYRVLDVPWLANYISGVYGYAVGIAAAIAGIMMIIGGFQYMTAGGDASRVGQAKSRINNAVIGMLLTLCAYLILLTINPDLVALTGTQIKVVQRVPFIPNETPASEADPTSGASSGPAIEPGELRPTTLEHLGQCGSHGRATPYLAQNGRCRTQPNGTPYTLCSSGCGVTSAAMVVASLTGRSGQTLMTELAELSSANGFRPCNSTCSDCSGTAGGFFTSESTVGRYGLEGQAVTGRARIDELLTQGRPLVALYGRGVFTGGGHYVVLAGKNPDGTYRVFDPGKGRQPYTYSCEQVRRGSASAPCPVSSDAMPQELIFSQLRGTWYIHAP